MAKGNKNTRTRNWTNVIYPESAPENWRDILRQMNIEFVVSPLHDKDINGDASEKKPHYHICYMFGGVKTYEQVQEVIKPLNGVAPQKVHNTKALIRYFLHLDNPEKVQYAKSDLFYGGGIDIEKILAVSSSERYDLIAEMMDFIDDSSITEITALLKYARTNRKEDWFPILCDNSAYLIGVYIKSLRHQEQKKQYDKEKLRG